MAETGQKLIISRVVYIKGNGQLKFYHITVGRKIVLAGKRYIVTIGKFKP